MNHRPEVVAFDILETVFSLETMRARLQGAGLAAHRLETWFAELLRDAFALDTAGIYKPFRDVAVATLSNLLDRDAVRAESEQIDGIVHGFSELEAHADAAPAMRALQHAEIRIVALTNGSASVTETLLERARLRPLVERVVSVDEVQHWKPRREVYLHCAQAAGVDPQALGMIAAHGWDIQGARRAGLITCFVEREGKSFPSTMEPPHVSGSNLIQVVDRLLSSD